MERDDPFRRGTWRPRPGQAVLFENLVRCVAKAGGRVRGVLWYQGESDADGENATTHADRFIRMAGAWRQALDNPDLIVLTVQLNRAAPPGP